MWPRSGGLGRCLVRRLRRLCFLPGARGAQHAPLDLGAGGRDLLLADEAAGAVALQLAKLVAVDGKVVIRPAGSAPVPPQHRDEHRGHGQRRQQGGGKREDHRLRAAQASSSRSASSRRRSSAESGAGCAPPAPPAPARARRIRA